MGRKAQRALSNIRIRPVSNARRLNLHYDVILILLFILTSDVLVSSL